MIEPTALPVLIQAFGLTWALSFGMVAGLHLRPQLRPRLGKMPTLMMWLIVTAGGVACFASVPHPLQWGLFLAVAARMLYEAIAIHRGAWSGTRILALFLSPALPLLLFSTLVGRDDAGATLFLTYFLIEVFDSFSLFGGRMFGARLMVPQLSPKKTWEGFATGAALTLLITLILAATGLLTLAQAFVCTFVTICAATAGDLAASLGKRLAGVKDYPVLIESQGGALDMFDSWIYAAPLTAFALQLAA